VLDTEAHRNRQRNPQPDKQSREQKYRKTAELVSSNEKDEECPDLEKSKGKSEQHI
jgi:hypothetical protein